MSNINLYNCNLIKPHILKYASGIIEDRYFRFLETGAYFDFEQPIDSYKYGIGIVL